MTAQTLYNIILWASAPLAIAIFVSLLFIPAPYGRHARRGWGPAIPNRFGWMIMESPSAILFAVLFFLGDVPKILPMLIFLILWESHYFHRTFIYPFRIANGKKGMPVSVILMGITFNLGNAYLNGYYLFSLSGGYPASWLQEPQMLVGLVIFVLGFTINKWADHVLRTIRLKSQAEYQIPYGGLYRWISCPNYFGEILEWIGWAIATWSLPGLAFAVLTIANLAPRALANHHWYHDKFADYPSVRKALIPKVW